MQETDGVLVTAQGVPVPRALVVVDTANSNALMSCMTDDNGRFEFVLVSGPTWLLSVPYEGVFDVPFAAGDSLVVVVP